MVPDRDSEDGESEATGVFGKGESGTGLRGCGLPEDGDCASEEKAEASSRAVAKNSREKRGRREATDTRPTTSMRVIR